MNISDKKYPLGQDLGINKTYKLFKDYLSIHFFRNVNSFKQIILPFIYAYTLQTWPLDSLGSSLEMNKAEYTDQMCTLNIHGLKEQVIFG